MSHPEHTPAPAWPSETGWGMPRRFGPVLQPLLASTFDAIPFADPAHQQRLVELSRRGTLVYVHRSKNVVDFLYLSRVLERSGLPRAEFVAGLDVLLFQRAVSLGRRWRRAWLTREHADYDEEHLLQETVAAGHSALLFLKRPLTLLNPRSQHAADYVAALIRAQRASTRPIYLVPQLLVFSQRPGQHTPSLGDTVFGSPEQPGFLRAVVKLFARRTKARLLVGEPLDLKQFIESHGEQDERRLTRKVRWLLLSFLAREDRVFNGPPIKSPARMRRDLLRDPQLARTLEAIAHQAGEPLPSLQERAKKAHDEIAARFDINVLNLFEVLLRQVFGRIYDGLLVDPADIQRVREAIRRAPVVLVPSHRSHLDYLVLSYLLVQNGLFPPFIAAGANLSFWPLGPWLRRSGAYFIRRTFKGDPLYAAVLRAYVATLMREGFTQEFFIEGTRSRSGKTLPPRLGLLSMLVDGFFESRRRDLLFIPVGIGYEKVVEEGSLDREATGGVKHDEGIGSLLRASTVLRSRYGRVHVTFAPPVSLSELLRQRGVVQEDHSAEERRDLVQHLGNTLSRAIDRAVPVTPTALAALVLLGHPKRVLAHRTLLQYAARALAHIREVTAGAARIATALQQLDDAMRIAAGRLVEEQLVTARSSGGEVFYSVVASRRLRLDRYKNNIVGFFMPEALIATVLDASTSGSKLALQDVVLRRCVELAELLQLEMILPPGGIAVVFEEVLTRASAHGAVQVTDRGLAVPQDPAARTAHAFLIELISSLIEAYWIAVRVAAHNCDAPLPRRDLVARALSAAREGLLAGDIFHSEACSKVTLQNAVEGLAATGALGVVPGKREALQLGEGWSPGRLLGLADELSRYLPR